MKNSSACHSQSWGSQFSFKIYARPSETCRVQKNVQKHCSAWKLHVSLNLASVRTSISFFCLLTVLVLDFCHQGNVFFKRCLRWTFSYCLQNSRLGAMTQSNAWTTSVSYLDEQRQRNYKNTTENLRRGKPLVIIECRTHAWRIAFLFDFNKLMSLYVM